MLIEKKTRKKTQPKINSKNKEWSTLHKFKIECITYQYRNWIATSVDIHLFTSKLYHYSSVENPNAIYKLVMIYVYALSNILSFSSPSCNFIKFQFTVLFWPIFHILMANYVYYNYRHAFKISLLLLVWYSIVVCFFFPATFLSLFVSHFLYPLFIQWHVYLKKQLMSVCGLLVRYVYLFAFQITALPFFLVTQNSLLSFYFLPISYSYSPSLTFLLS